jgi:hypothetical protein
VQRLPDGKPRGKAGRTAVNGHLKHGTRHSASPVA